MVTIEDMNHVFRKHGIAPSCLHFLEFSIGSDILKAVA